MADPNTAAQWRQSASNLQQKLDALNNNFSNIKSDITQTTRLLEQSQSQTQAARAQLDLLRAQGASASQIQQAESTLAASASNTERLQAVNDNLTALESQYNQGVAELNSEIANANNQAAIAEQGAPNTVENPAPVNPNPGNNTDTTPLTSAQQPNRNTTVPTGTPYDDEGNLNVGWALNENNDPVYVGADFVDPSIRQSAERSRANSNTTVPTGTPYDDDGNLNPGWTLNENNDPVYVGGDFVESATRQSAERSRAEAASQVTTSASRRSAPPFAASPDWRVRLSLAPSADYLYKVPAGQAGILNPLQSTNGVIFPYTPTIGVTYTASYDQNDITHSNYKIYTYKGSAVENISITGDFTAQDSSEANYMLAVIHFFRTATKMFYGQDQNPARGVPPPLCYLSGHGEYQFDNHPLAITNFSYTLPNDVDYINAYPNPGSSPVGGINLRQYNKPYNSYSTPTQRLFGSGLRPGGVAPRPFTNAGKTEAITRVPTKIQLTIQCIPIVTRNAVSNKFSLKEYATGQLLRGRVNSGTGGGMW